MDESSSDVDASRMTELLLKRFGLRVQPEMGRFVLGRLRDSKDSTIPIIAGDARTGVAVRQLLAARDLHDAMQSFAAPSTI
jgi:hypothetical protein